MILLIDNYDSFTYNLYQYIEEIGYRCKVVRNDKIDLAGIRKLNPSHIVLSPGPGIPEESRVCLDVLLELKGKIPIFGVCLGHQAIGLIFGARVVRAKTLMHGKVSQVFHDGKTIFKGIPNPLLATRYHSLIVVDPPKVLQVSAKTEDGTIMALRHRDLPIEGVQFHPESMMTPHGKDILRNFFMSSPRRRGSISY